MYLSCGMTALRRKRKVTLASSTMPVKYSIGTPISKKPSIDCRANTNEGTSSAKNLKCLSNTIKKHQWKANAAAHSHLSRP